MEALWRQRSAEREGGGELASLPIPEDAAGLDVESLPPGAESMGFLELAMALAADKRGYALLTGVEDGAAGLELFQAAEWRGAARLATGCAFSFCVNGVTYTAFEDPDDGYRSSLSHLVARPGNWCKVRFEPCALLPRFRTSRHCVSAEGNPMIEPGDERAQNTDLLELLHPGTSEVALVVGTESADDYYPCFVATHDSEVLTRAHALGIAVAYAMEADALAQPAPAGGRSRL